MGISAVPEWVTVESHRLMAVLPIDLIGELMADAEAQDCPVKSLAEALGGLAGAEPAGKGDMPRPQAVCDREVR